MQRVVVDDQAPAPDQPTDEQMVAEGVKIAIEVGNSAAANEDAQYVVFTASQHNTASFTSGGGFCAYHGSVPSRYGNIAITYDPYLPDAGASCDAGAVNRGNMLDGVSIVAGHEYAESATDPFPNAGWNDRYNQEVADKCENRATGAQGGPADITLSTGTFAVQNLWSNDYGPNGACVISYASPTKQH